MEDQGRELESDQKIVTPVKGGKKERKEFTIMVMRSVGKIRSFKISLRIILITAIFLFLYILSSVYILNDYFAIRSKHKTLTNKMDILEENLRSYQEELHDTNLYVASLEDYLQNGSEEPVKTDIDKKPDTDLTPPGRSVQVGDAETAAEKSISGIVEIWDLTFKNIDRELVLDFKLANIRTEDNAAEGYIHIIAMDVNKECPETWNNSSAKLTGCIPVNYRNEFPFSIQRFKSYHKTFKLNSESELPSFITILVYDRSGHILLEKELPVINVSTEENM